MVALVPCGVSLVVCVVGFLWFVCYLCCWVSHYCLALLSFLRHTHRMWFLFSRWIFFFLCCVGVGLALRWISRFLCVVDRLGSCVWLCVVCGSVFGWVCFDWIVLCVIIAVLCFVKGGSGILSCSGGVFLLWCCCFVSLLFFYFL